MCLALYLPAVASQLQRLLPAGGNPPAVNVENAGRAIPVKFSLSGNKGLDIFAAGCPVSQQFMCNNGALVGGIEETSRQAEAV